MHIFQVSSFKIRFLHSTQGKTHINLHGGVPVVWEILLESSAYSHGQKVKS